MATRLKRLDLHGFKSFATPTSFVFDTGFTAVIGPNGSGKSNISDGLRWVLGEQSYTNLRGRRTEDIIFAGSASRAPVGMAEVTVTLDNEDGSLPVAFSEVSVTRRAFRSGENQYLINGSRVRLKDVLQVTASLGQSHTVIGQGLVDAVLSQRADERRSLFEHAAGITGLRIKHATAARNLEESQTNCTRLEDLLSDLEPRLRSLERAAKQAREYDDVKRQLRSALERSYARYWIQSTERLSLSQQAADDLSEKLNAANRDRDDLRQQLARAVAAVAERSTGIEKLRAEIARLRDEEQHKTHELELIEERQAATRIRRADAERALSSVETSRADLAREREGLAASLEDLRDETASREAHVRDLETAHAASRDAVAQLEAERTAADRERASVEREMLETETRISLLRGKLEQFDAEGERLQAGSDERDARRDELQAEAARIGEAEAELSQRVAQLADDLTSVNGQLPEKTGERDSLRTKLAGIERRSMEAGTRFETLKRLEESGVGLYAGVRQVLDESRRGRLTGVLGTLSSLLMVPAELEAAIEAAMGGHLQDLVVERWSDAEAAIEHLKRTQKGRATFHPLDSIRDRGRSAAPRGAQGIRGVAVDLIDMDERVEPVVAGLLGRVLVAEDLDAARDALRSLSPGWSVVTLGGEIVRSGGTVTGGSRIKESGALARERELRELPQLQANLEKQRDRLASGIREVDGAIAELTALRAGVEESIASARSEARHLEVDRQRLERQRFELDRQVTSEQERADRLESQRATTLEELTEVSDRRTTIGTQLREVEAEAARLRDAVRQATSAIDDSALQAARSALSGHRERVRSVVDQVSRIEARIGELDSQQATGQSRLRELDATLVELVVAHQSMSEERDELSARLAALRVRHDAAQSDQLSLARQESAARTSLESAEARCRDLERRHDQTSLEATRRRDELDLTIERAARDLEETEVEPILSRVDAAESDELPRLEREIVRLRERLRRIGVAGDDAIEQYEREAERFAFMRRQLDDVRSATEALRTLMSELDRTMASEFDRTFSEVARAFETTFTALFGGGRARLIRSDDGDGPTGIDIVAQPPGKRLQNLGLLSGGERALTAVALLFSILKVNPSPFCLLDEVDAALDEANVVRVRDELQRLAEKTQFVVVTHNRSTIEGADTLYGITMGDDGISRVLSLRMPAEAASGRTG